MKENAVAYIRVSTDDQADISPEVQREDVIKYGEKNNLNIVKIFEEIGKSGWKDREKRIEYYKMLTFIKKNKTEHLLAILSDRLYRNIEDYVELRNTKVNIRVHIIQTDRPDLPTRNFAINDPEAYEEIYRHETDVADAKRFSARLSHRVRKSFDKKWHLGEYTSRAPLGYWHNPMNDKKYKIELDHRENRAKLVLQAFKLMSIGDYSLTQIAAKMKNLGLTTRQGNPPSRSSLAAMFRNPFYYGEFRVKGDIFKGNYEPLLSKALWDRVQERLDGRRTTKPNSKDFLFKGLIICGYCGCNLVGEVEKEKYIYYHCTSGKAQSNPNYYRKKFGTRKCPLHDTAYLRKEHGYHTYKDDKRNKKPVYDGHWFREEDIKKYFEAAINVLEIDEQRKDELIKIITEQNEERKNTDEIEIKNLRRTEKEIEQKMSKMFDEKLKGHFPEDFILKEFNKLKAEKDDIEASIEAFKEDNQEKIEKGLLSLELLRNDFKTNYLKAFFEADSEKRKELADFMFRTIEAGACKYHIAALQPLQFVWNETFEKFFDIGILKRAAKYEEEILKNKVSYTWPDSNQRLTD